MALPNVGSCADRIEGALRDGRGLIVRGSGSVSGTSLDRALRAGVIERVVPGVYCRAGSADLALRARAVSLLDPNAIITGRSAAALTWWPELTVKTLDVAYRGRREPCGGIRWHQQLVPAEHVVEADGLRFTSPSLTVLDLIPELGGRPIDEALRRRAATLAEMEAALESLPRRPGNAQRRYLLDDSRDEPWSEAERKFHRGYRALALPYAYRTNFKVVLPDGSSRFLDVALPELLLGFEVDGYEFHGSRGAYRRDRVSDAQLAVLSWQRVRFDATDVFDDEAGVQRTVLGVVAAREALFRGTRPSGTGVSGRRRGSGSSRSRRNATAEREGVA